MAQDWCGRPVNQTAVSQASHQNFNGSFDCASKVSAVSMMRQCFFSILPF